MPLFRRNNALPEDEPYVNTKTNWRPLQSVVDEGWPSLAAAAWSGFMEHGRGAVIADFFEEELHYAVAAAMGGDPNMKKLLDLCRRYNPRGEIVLGTMVIPRFGHENEARMLITVLHPPRDAPPPPKAAAYLQYAEAQHQRWISIQAQIGIWDSDHR